MQHHWASHVHDSHRFQTQSTNSSFFRHSQLPFRNMVTMDIWHLCISPAAASRTRRRRPVPTIWKDPVARRSQGGRTRHRRRRQRWPCRRRVRARPRRIIRAKDAGYRSQPPDGEDASSGAPPAASAPLPRRNGDPSESIPAARRAKASTCSSLTRPRPRPGGPSLPSARARKAARHRRSPPPPSRPRPSPSRRDPRGRTLPPAGLP